MRPKESGAHQPPAPRHVLSLVAWRPEELTEKQKRVRLELNELQSDVEARHRAGWQALDPDHLGRVRNWGNVRKKELHLQQLADFELVIAEDTDSPQADVDGLLLASKELHPGWTAIQSRSNAAVLSAVLIVVRH
jgi:hypothetical protein